MSELLLEHFEHWRDRWSWIIGAIIFMTAIAVMITQYRSPRPPRIFRFVGLAMGIGIGSLLFFPAVPRIVTALQLLVIARAPTDTSGPFPVATTDISLPSATAGDPAILAQIWYPTASSPSAVAKRPDSTVPPLCSKVLDQSCLADAEQQFPLIVYAPGNTHRRDDSASTAAELASQGYIVMAIDDIERDPHRPVVVGETLQPLTFNFSSAEAFDNTLRTGDRKARLQAERALMALDRFEVCANADWRARVYFNRVGFFGYSFGGTTAAEAGTIDPRVAAVVNLDGALMGRAAFGALEKPYMVILIEDDIFPKRSQLQSSDPNKRYLATLAERDLREEVRLVDRL